MNDPLIFSDLSYPNLRPRRPNDALTTLAAWWTTSDGSVFIPSETTPAPSSSSSAIPDHSASISSQFTNSSIGNGGDGGALTTFTTSVAVSTFTQDSTTFTSFTPSVVTSSLSSPTSSSFPSRSQSASAGLSSTTPSSQLEFHNPVCIGDGLDSISDGVIASIVLPTAIGLVLWVRCPPSFYGGNR